MFARQWFRRAWIVQEYVVGAKEGVIFYCGKDRLLGSDLNVLHTLPMEWGFRDAEKLCGNRLDDIIDTEFEAWGDLSQSEELKSKSETEIFNYIAKHFRLGMTAMATLRSLKRTHDVGGINGVECNDEYIHFWLAKMCNTKLSDPRDKVYATLSLLDECHGSGQLSSINPGSLVIDYNASVADVYSSLARAVYESTKRLGILSACMR